MRDYTNWSDTALKVHLARLAEMEYLLIHRGGRGQSYAYELLYQGEGEQREPFLMGLIDVEALRGKHGYNGKRSGQKADRSGAGQGGKNGHKACNDKGSVDLDGESHAWGQVALCTLATCDSRVRAKIQAGRGEGSGRAAFCRALGSGRS